MEKYSLAGVWLVFQVVKRLSSKSTVALVVHAEQSETISFKLLNATAQGWQGIQEGLKVDSGEVHGSANEMVRLTLDAQPLAKGLGLSRDSKSLVVAPELLGIYKVQRSTDLIHWEESPISGENAETGLTIDPDQSHEFYRLIRRCSGIRRICHKKGVPGIIAFQ